MQRKVRRLGYCKSGDVGDSILIMGMSGEM